MKAFFTSLLMFSLPLVVLLGGIEWALSTIPNTYSTKYERLMAGQDEWQVLVLGASDADAGIDPAAFEWTGMNMAGPGRTLYYDAALAATYIPECPRLRVVLIPVAYFSMEVPFIAGEPWRAYFYSRYYNLPPEKGKWQLDLRKVSLIALYGQRESLAYLLDGFHINLASNISEHGWNCLGYDPAQLASITREKAVERARFLEAGGPSYIKYNMNNLKQIITQCRAAGVEPILLRMPLTRVFREARDPKRLARDEIAIHHVCEAEDVHLYDYSTDERFVDQDFYNTDHLNSTGAMKFSVILNQEVLSPRLRVAALE